MRHFFKSFPITLLLLTVFISTVIAQQSKPAPPPPPSPPLPVDAGEPIPVDPDVRMGKLDNGLTYYILVNGKPENRAELRLAVNAGSMQEDDDQLGVAHFVEHMAFNGSRNFSKNELVDYLEKVGSRFGPDLNAYTSFDETVYMLQVRTDDKEQLDKGLLILRDWAEGVSFDSTEIDKERGVVISEWRSRLSANQRMSQEYLPVMYYNSRYAARLPIGEPDIIQHAPYDVFRRYYREWYRPDLMSIFVVGAVDADEIEGKIRSSFSTIPLVGKARDKESNAVPAHAETFARVITDAEATNSVIRLMYKHRQGTQKTIHDYRERLVHSLFNRMMGARLQDRAEDPDPPYLFGNSGFGQDVGELATYTSFASADGKKIRQAYHTLLEENQRVLLHGFTADELSRAKTEMMEFAERNALEADKQESSRLVQRLIYHFLRESPIPSARQHLDLYKKLMPTVTLAEINQLASGWITDQNRVIILTGPDKDKEFFPDSAELVQILNESSAWNPEPYSDVDLSAPLIARSFESTAISGETVDTSYEIYSWTLQNGIRVTAKPTTFKNDEILMNAYSPGGHSLYNDEIYPSATFSAEIITESGAGPYKASDLDKKLAGKTVRARPFIFERYEGINGSSSVKDLETLFQLSYAYLVTFREDEESLQSYITKRKGMFANILDNPNNWFGDKVSRITSGYHPRRGFPDSTMFTKVEMDQVQFVYSDRFGDVSDMEFFFVGNFNVDTLKALTNRYLAALPGGGRQEQGKDLGVRYPAHPIDSSFHRGEAPKSLVQLIFHGPDVYDPDTAYVMQCLVDVARIKLREALREDQGGVYGVSIGGGQSKFPEEYYSIRVSFNADPPQTKALEDLTFQVLEKLTTTIDPNDIVKITEAQRQSLNKNLQQNNYWMNLMLDEYLNDTPLADAASPEKLEARIASINEDVLRRAARKYFNDQRLIQLVMHPESFQPEGRP